jgi:hypothetical protein
MNWIERWRAISARIIGLIEATNFLLRTYRIENQNTGEVGRLLGELREIQEELIKLRDEYDTQMPPLAVAALSHFCSKRSSDSSPSGSTTELQLLAGVQVFRAKFDYLIRDSEIEVRNATELAFHHLQRLIVVDEDTRKKWKRAYAEGETSCEKLGAVHLLAHGIWAFKVRGGQAETDLVYGETGGMTAGQIGRSARAMVLTEWKIVRNAKDAQKKAAEARRETDEYEAGVLGDLELKRTRYIILVGDRQNRTPSDLEQHGVLYRHIWIPVEPESPSRAARRRGR